MRFLVIVNRWANFFFFVNNLSGWHFSTIKPYNEYWLKKLGVLTKAEQKTLKQFGNLQRRWPKERRELSDFFFKESSPLAAINGAIPPSEQRAVRQAFAVLQAKFERLYKLEHPALRHWQRCLRIALNAPQRNRRIRQALASLYGPACAACSRPLPLYLLISAPGGIGGSADVDGFRITAEVSQSPLSPRGELPHILGTIWHEVIHLCFDKQRFRPILERLYPKDEQTVRRINEVVAASLFPAGILGKRFFQIPLQPPTRHLASPENAERISALTDVYLQKKQHLDKTFVENARKLLDQME